MARQEGFAFPAGKATAVATCHRHVPKCRLSNPGLLPRKRVARQEGFEPPAYCLEGSCSIQLSYWRIGDPFSGDCLKFPKTQDKKSMERVMGIEPTCSAWKADILPLNYTRGSPETITLYRLCAKKSSTIFIIL